MHGTRPRCERPLRGEGPFASHMRFRRTVADPVPRAAHPQTDRGRQLFFMTMLSTVSATCSHESTQYSRKV